ncbi:MAG: hypothetical protein KJO79_09425, partial [Verrucomicrobiae bacterium]|nr:hypothetical protein [Verrucomicrobiae bacterium]NNJ87389.1 hypothetical protein [Akkermansiaceae bacterium]
EHTRRTNTFPRQLGFWSLHCGLTALPSFIIAISAFKGLPAIIAMICGIATFVFAYAFITSTPLYGKVHDRLIGRSIKLGTRIRMIISVASLPLLIPIIGVDIDSVAEPPTSVFFTPDFWFGYVAIIIAFLAINAVTQGSLTTGGTGGGPDQLGEEFLLPYTATIIEGLLISLSLVFIAFIVLIVLNFRRNRQQMPSQYFPEPPDMQGR